VLEKMGTVHDQIDPPEDPPLFRMTNADVELDAVVVFMDEVPFIADGVSIGEGLLMDEVEFMNGEDESLLAPI
jgi:hypothetical protein